MKIELPDWSYYSPGVDGFLEWFDEHVDPINKMLAEGVEIYQEQTLMDSLWDTDKKAPNMKFTRKAILIDVKPIQKDTAQDILKDWVSWVAGNKSTINKFTLDQILIRAKAVLEGENE